MRVNSRLKSDISAISAGYHFKVGECTNPSSDITELGDRSLT